MARWKLGTAHTLWVQGNTWEYKEVDRTTGKFVRKTWAVPRLLDPNDPSDWNAKNGDDGYIVVCHPGKGEPNDIEFFLNSKFKEPGHPGPDMVPLDDEAKAISATYRWGAPGAPMPNGAYTESLMDDFHKQMSELQAKGGSVDKGIQDVLSALTAIVKQNSDMMQMLLHKNESEAAPKVATRR